MKQIIGLLFAFSSFSAFAVSVPTAISDQNEAPVMPIYMPTPDYGNQATQPEQKQLHQKGNPALSLPNPSLSQPANHHPVSINPIIRVNNPALKELVDGKFYPESHFMLPGYTLVSKVDNTIAKNFDINHDGISDMSLTLMKSEYVTIDNEHKVKSPIPNFTLTKKSIPPNSMISIQLIANEQGLYKVLMVTER